MNEPRRIQRKRTKGWRMPDGAVYVGRPTIWGNPFTGDDAAERYRQAVSEFPIPKDRLDAWKAAGGRVDILYALTRLMPGLLNQLRGHDLVCWCPLGKPCHADVLLEIVNETVAQ